MSIVPTPHIAAQKDEIAKTVLMPGDPKRSKWMAETFLEDAVLVNDIRGVQGYTGLWNGKKVTVMSSGMGIPSISIYAYELFNFYDVDNIIRCGTCGSIREDVDINDVIIADKAYTDVKFYSHFNVPARYVAKSDAELLKKAKKAAKEIRKKGKVIVGPVLTQQIYYSQEKDCIEKWQKKGVLGFEMEAAALFANAYQAKKKALSVFTVSNNIIKGTEMDPADREKSLADMVNIALKAALE